MKLTQIHAGNHDFTVSGVEEPLRFGQNFGHGAAAGGPSRERNDAVGAAVGAALGNAQIGEVGGGGQYAGQLLHRAEPALYGNGAQ